MGDATDVYGAMEFILKMCANLDATQIRVVQKYIDQLAQITNEPVEGNIKATNPANTPLKGDFTFWSTSYPRLATYAPWC